MNKKLRIINSIVYAVGLMFMLPLSSCSDSDNKGSETENITLEEKQVMSQLGAIRDVLNVLAGVESLPDDFCQQHYSPSYGEVLDESNPFVRAFVADNQGNAYKQFEMIVGPDASISPTEDGFSVELKLPTDLAEQEKRDLFGKLTYHKGGESTRVAYVDVEIPNIPNLQRIDFIPSKLWGDNDGNTSAFKLGELAEYKGNKDGYGKGIWVCVREKHGPYDGALVHMNYNFDSNFCKFYEDPHTITKTAWSGIFYAWAQDVPSYLEFISEFNILLQDDIKYLRENGRDSEQESICPRGFMSNGYVYDGGSYPAAIIRDTYEGHYRAFHGWWRVCKYYYIEKKSKDGNGYDTTFQYTNGDKWNSEMWRKHEFYTINAVHFKDKIPEGFTLLHSPAVLP